MSATRSAPVPLDSLLLALPPQVRAALPAAAGVEVSDVTLDSRAVRPGGLFLACRGRRTHGLAHLGEARERGARVVLWEPGVGVSSFEPRTGEWSAPVAELSRVVGGIADRFFGAPSAALDVAGVTGTNGKTTCAWLLAAALTALGRRCGYMGTLGVGLPDALCPSTHTTADAVSIHRQLAELRRAGAAAVALEVSSHALDQDRVAGVRFRVAAFTNLTRDHLDYHGTMEAYGEAKAKLFAWPGLDARVINVDDGFGSALARRAAAPGRLIATARLASAADVTALAPARWLRAVRATPGVRGLDLTLDSSDEGRVQVSLPLIGEFNADNALTVLAMLQALDVPLARAADALSQCPAPAGRMEVFGGGDLPLAIVDYAHTPDALAKALRAARHHCRGRLTAVFGCGGDRDAGKRPLMGRVAAELADAIVLTDDNPRDESPARIVADVAAGLPPGYRPVRIEHDRARAIAWAVAASAAGDVVLVAGKGHEDDQIYGQERRVFRDQDAVRAALGLAPGPAVRAPGRSAGPA